MSGESELISTSGNRKVMTGRHRVAEKNIEPVSALGAELCYIRILLLLAPSIETTIARTYLSDNTDNRVVG